MARSPAPDGAPPAQMQRILLAAAHRDTVGEPRRRGARRRAHRRRGGPRPAGADPGDRPPGRATTDCGAEAIVSIGGGVTVMVVHETGLPRFVRVLGLGGRLLTDAIARDLEIPFDQAEALKRQTDQAPEQIARARPRRDGAPARASSSSRSAARSTTTARSRARRGCCGSRSPAARRSLPGLARAARRRSSACRSRWRRRAISSRSATSGSRPIGSRPSTRTCRRRPASRSAGSRPVGASTCSVPKAAPRRRGSGR